MVPERVSPSISHHRLQVLVGRSVLLAITFTANVALSLVARFWVGRVVMLAIVSTAFSIVMSLTGYGRVRRVVARALSFLL